MQDFGENFLAENSLPVEEMISATRKTTSSV